LYVITYASFCPTKTIQTLSKKDSIPLENVLIFNESSSKFGYTNEDGKYSINTENVKDSIFIDIAGYESRKITFEKLNQSIYLKRKVNYLDEVMINAPDFKNLEKFSPKIKNNYTTCFISSGGAMLCSVDLKRKFKNDSLIGFSVKIANSKKNVFVRPMLIRVNKKTNEWRFLLQTPKTLALKENNKSLMFDLSDFKIKFNDNFDYLIGFELIDRNNTEDKVLVYGGECKNANLYLRANPMSDREEVENLNYSLDYKLYIKDAD
jgi:hypothetical protein